MKILRIYLHLSRPLSLLSVILVYALGGGVVRYLGYDLDWGVYWLGQIWVSVLQLGAHYLNGFYNISADVLPPAEESVPGEENSSAIDLQELRRGILITAFACFAVLASLTVLIIAQLRPGPVGYLVMGLAFFGALFYSLPPLSLEYSGYGELMLSVMIAFLVPAFAFLFQVGELHRLLAMVGSVLTALHLAMLLAIDLSIYASNTKHNRRTLLIRMGWSNGLTLHNLLVLSSFLLLALAVWFGFPWSITWPALLLLPLGLYQIWQMRAIANGGKPNWPVLKVGAMALFGAMAYLITFAFWVN